MAVTRGTFLKSLGKAVPGMIFGGGVAVAHRLATKIAAVAQPESAPLPVATNATPRIREEYLRRGPTHTRRVALTFDDGPTPGITDRILDELQRREVRATFFMIGERVAAAPALARRVADEGHEIGNHSYTHPKFSALSAAQVKDEIARTQAIIAEATGTKPRWFRPPYGDLRPAQAAQIRADGLEIVLWSVDPRDWSQPCEEAIREAILREAAPGAIVLCHDLHPQTANCMGAVMADLIARDYSFGSLSDVMRAV